METRGSGYIQGVLHSCCKAIKIVQGLYVQENGKKLIFSKIYKKTRVTQKIS